MMKKVISLVFGLLIGLAVWAQGTADTSASAKDSVSIGSHTEFSATKSADNVTKHKVTVHICVMIMLLPFKYMRAY